MKEAYGKVTLEHFWSTVCVVATDFTRVTDVESMQLVQPVWYWLQTQYITLAARRLSPSTFIHKRKQQLIVNG